jgi:3-hydroxyisobutyrate dehydrogenase-like beta-hydroxyacid dehydrogenase
MKIGFIGLGIMGSRMAADLQKHGHSLVVFNRTRAKAEPLLGPCGTFSDSPAKVADQVDVLFTMLVTPTQSDEQPWARTDFWIISSQTRFGSIAVR